MASLWILHVVVTARADGRILQPDKPATAVDSMFAQARDGAQSKAPPGEVWSTYVTMEQMIWYYLLSIDVQVPWKISEIDMFPSMVTATLGATNKVGTADARDEHGGWVAHQWFKGHIPTPCQHGSHAIASGCIAATVRCAHAHSQGSKSSHAPHQRWRVLYSLLRLPASHVGDDCAVAR